MPRIPFLQVLALAPLAAVLAHIFEEFVFPGGFSSWYRGYSPDAAASFTPRFAVGINALLIAVCVVIPVLGLEPRGVALWLTTVALLVGNALFHVSASVRTRRYSPGVVTAVLLYLPLGIYGYWYLVHSDRASLATAVGAAVLGGSYNLLSAWVHHRRAARSRK